MNMPVAAFDPAPPQFGDTHLSDIMQTVGVTGIVMSEPGVGKTRLVRSLPPDRTLLYDIDGGFATLLEAPKWEGSIESCPKDLVVDGPKSLKAFSEWITTAQHRFTTVVFDSISNLERRLVFAYAAKRNKDLVDVKEYGDASTKLRQYLLAWRDMCWLGINVIFMCQTKANVKGRDGVIYPFLSDQLANEIIGLVDFCGYLTVNPDGMTRTMQFAPSASVRTKTRYSTITKPYIEQPNLAAIIRDIRLAMKTPPAAPVDPVSNPPPAANAASASTQVQPGSSQNGSPASSPAGGPSAAAVDAKNYDEKKPTKK